MFDKRLMAMCPESKKYIAGNIICQWIELLMNAVMIFIIANAVGKHTLQDGVISIAGLNVSDISEDSLCSKVNYVGIGSTFFKGTVRQNLLLAKSGASDEELWNVLKECNIDGFFREDKGLDSLLTENAGNLSGGQKQRLALARAILHDAKIYIFDEATSNIDVESEEMILEEIRELAKTKTVIMITHRLMNVIDDDRIYCIKDGRITGKGTHSDLIEEDETYKELWNTQKELAEFIPILGGEAILIGIGVQTEITWKTVVILLLSFALLRAIFRLLEQRTNHYIAFTLLAIIRDRVFKALRRLCPAKLEGRDKGDLISLITADVELLEVFYAHTISPICIAVVSETVMCLFIGSFHPLLGLLAMVAFLLVGIALPVVISKRSKTTGDEIRSEAGAISAHMLESIRGIDDTLQYSYGDKRLEEISTDNLRDMESYMTQQTQLFKDTIANNIRIGKLDATDEEVIEACKKASVHDFIMTLPEGYETKVGELGSTLSGGEKQRIGLARAFLQNAPFMLLDEPTSNLDSLNEAVILKSLKEEAKERTVLLVSHRQSTVRIADEILTMEGGRIS